nr:MAG TPA: hypothetical protein [Caudoviricetes sp.]
MLLNNYKYLEYLYKYSIRLHQPSEAKNSNLEASRFRSDVKLPNDFACFPRKQAKLGGSLMQPQT